MSDENARPVRFDMMLDAVDAECPWCGLEGKVDRWTVRDAETYDETLVCPDCGDRGHALPSIDGFAIHYRGHTWSTMALPERFYGERVTRDLRIEIADVLDERIENGDDELASAFKNAFRNALKEDEHDA